MNNNINPFAQFADKTKAPTQNISTGGFIWDTGIYDVTIKKVGIVTYPPKIAGGKAFSIAKIIVSAEEKLDLTLDILGVTDQTSRGGFSLFNTLHTTAAGISATQATAEEGTISLFGKDVKATLITSLAGKKLQIAVSKEIVAKTSKTIQETTGKIIYRHLGLTCEINTLRAVFHTDGTTLAEKTNNKPAEFASEWLATWGGKVIDKTPGKVGLVTELPPTVNSGCKTVQVSSAVKTTPLPADMWSKE